MKRAALFLVALAALALPACGAEVAPMPDAGTAGTGGACETGTKFCGVCVPEDADHGCSAASCEPCYFAMGTAACSADGACAVAACNAGWSQCPGDIGCMTHTDADAANCGACGNVCSFPHASTECFGGECWMGACEAGWGSCYDDPPTNGCETHTDSDPKNCGACGNVCDAGNTCKSGACTPCAGCIAADGTCTSGIDDLLCGSGGVACKNCGPAMCYAGKCG